MSEDRTDNAEEPETAPDAPVDEPEATDRADDGTGDAAAGVDDIDSDAIPEAGIVDAEMVENTADDSADDSADASTDAAAGGSDDEGADASRESDTGSARGRDGTAEAPARPVVRRKIVSKRVTPKGGGPARSTGPATRASVEAAKKRAKGKTEPDDLLVMHDEPSFAERYQAAAKLPSPWWVPALMFGLLIVGALIIMLNYMGVFGDPSNVRLIIGLVFILGGIITATQYR